MSVFDDDGGAGCGDNWWEDDGEENDDDDFLPDIGDEERPLPGVDSGNEGCTPQKRKEKEKDKDKDKDEAKRKGKRKGKRGKHDEDGKRRTKGHKNGGKKEDRERKGHPKDKGKGKGAAAKRGRDNKPSALARAVGPERTQSKGAPTPAQKRPKNNPVTWGKISGNEDSSGLRRRDDVLIYALKIAAGDFVTYVYDDGSEATLRVEGVYTDESAHGNLIKAQRVVSEGDTVYLTNEWVGLRKDLHKHVRFKESVATPDFVPKDAALEWNGQFADVFTNSAGSETYKPFSEGDMKRDAAWLKENFYTRAPDRPVSPQKRPAHGGGAAASSRARASTPRYAAAAAPPARERPPARGSAAPAAARSGGAKQQEGACAVETERLLAEAIKTQSCAAEALAKATATLGDLLKYSSSR
jgi:hypothetical protein